MTPREFYDTVCAMRKAQKKYFKSRSSFDLTEAKRLEKIIDDEINRVDFLTGRSDTPEPLSLFPDTNLKP